jgi:hypothetical protein
VNRIFEPANARITKHVYARAGQRERAGIELAAAGRLFGGMAMAFWLARAECALDRSP